MRLDDVCLHDHDQSRMIGIRVSRMCFPICDAGMRGRHFTGWVTIYRRSTFPFSEE
ncbi:hypothetical protein [Actinoplanes sp. NPDC026619]|uniref:hypothetical protein n=1 Tax=Actinoplanes sp. NPDC026619 TaxID=3155798 RepID=UPI0033D02974